VYFNAAVGAGLSAHWWDSWSMTAQVRLWKYEQKKDMTPSGLLLIGYRF